MRIAYPSVTRMGLGNNLITVAKAYLIADSCGMHYQRPAWPANEHVTPPTSNGYGYYFPASLPERVRLRCLSSLHRIQKRVPIRLGPPVLAFDRPQYEQIGITDVGQACAVYLRSLGLDDHEKSVVVATSGMWGAYAAIRRARSWLRELLWSHAETRRRFEDITARMNGRLRVAVNIKMGSYGSARGRFEEGERCVRLPLDWFVRVCRLVRQACDCEFVLVTDGTADELEPLLEEIRPVHYLGESYTDVLGLLLLIDSDLVVCSNSTYSRLACFLNDKPYVWIADTLVRHPSGLYGCLWRPDATPMPTWLNSPVRPASGSRDAIRRCVALSYDFAALPPGLVRYLGSGGRLPIEIGDDLLYGSLVPLE